MENPVKGTVDLGDGKITFTPEADFSGPASFDYTVCDDGSPQKCSVQTAKVEVTISAVNDASKATDDSATTDEDKATDVAVLANDADADSGDTLSVSSFAQPEHGTLSKNADGTLKYTPEKDYNGSDSFTYEATDGTADSNEATVNITVNAVNDAPTLTVARGGACATDGRSGTMNITVADADSAAGALTLSAASANKALVPDANVKFGGSGAERTVAITPAAKKSGKATIAITASDGTAKTTTTTINAIVGTDGNDRALVGTEGADITLGQNGNDTISALGANDLICGGDGNDTVSGGAGDDALDGANGNDVLRGEAGDDFLIGGNGNDTLEGAEGDDALTGGLGGDRFDGGSGTDTVADFDARKGDSKTNIP